MASTLAKTWPNLTPKNTYDLITGDFEQLWNSLSSIKGKISRGNFAFALLDMILVEFISRFCKVDTTGNMLRTFSDCLYDIDKRYFGNVKGWDGIRPNSEFTLPFKSQEGKELLCLLFDLIRNGEAHQYQQIIADLKDATLAIRISGANYGLNLGNVTSRGKHLEMEFSSLPQKILAFIDFRPEIMYLDLKRAVECSKMFDNATTFTHFSRNYDIPMDSIANAIGHNERIENALQGKDSYS